MKFEWDENKEKTNFIKYGIDFRTAALVFCVDFRIETFDEAHSNFEEDRYITIGMIHGTITVIMVVYTERADTIRIISARIATKREREAYYHGQI